MSNLVLHPDTTAAIDQFYNQPSHALLLVGASGGGKGSLARQLSARLLDTTDDKLAQHPYFRNMDIDEGIAAVRDLRQFATLKVPGANRSISRIAVIEAADKLTNEAQTAVLKLLEEPPAGMLLILTAEHERALLPTIRSRVQVVSLKPPLMTDLHHHFVAAGYSAEAVTQALRMAAGLPGIAWLLLTGEADQPLLKAAEAARTILGQGTFERLLLVDSLSKQKDLANQTITMIIRMAQAALAQVAATNGPEASQRADRWQHILNVAAVAQTKLLANAQTKLVLTDFMLAL